jgi:inorganic pyrophosphatase
MNGIYTCLAFIIGATTSMICGAVGMYIATFTNYRTTICCKRSIGDGFNTAFKAGTVMGFSLVSLSLIGNFNLMKF